MRTTLDIDDDVLFAAKELAAKEKKTAGKILSEYFKRAIQTPNPDQAPPGPGRGYALKNGIPILPSRGEVVTGEHIQRIMEDEGI